MIRDTLGNGLLFSTIPDTTETMWVRYNGKGYNGDVILQTASLVVGPINVRTLLPSFIA